MPSWKELKRFCENDGWELYKTTDHYFYRKIDA
ncbi:MAG TPA: type II toxin-antitoxin system HicA family toxin, partial [Bacillota bacterium]|nr:type II toxin-antitoxin system HicA family toxin [Bacillota bacterium]HNT03342.1 type II toxin-antitoxin system HicA family toxin [Bacillota bacterium]HQA66417.1 type II toxin-antitoxin system HicA family toxin [Bacillota bacterium]